MNHSENSKAQCIDYQRMGLAVSYIKVPLLTVDG